MQEKIVVLGIFIICAQSVIHFCPGNVYAKYLRLLLSMMVLVQLLQPILQVTLGNSSSLQDLAGNLWEQIGDQWSTEWKSVAGYEEQIDAIWDREVGEYVQTHMSEAESTGAEGMSQSEQYAVEAVPEATEEGIEKVVIQIDSMETIRIGE